MSKFTFNTKRFQSALNKYMDGSKRKLETVLKQQAKGIVRNVIAVTPPGGPNVSPGKARQRGTRKVKRDISKVVLGVSDSRVQQQNIEAAVSPFRRNGTIRRGPAVKVKVPRQKLAQFIRMKQSHVGKLASGWKPAARKFGATVPAWVARHNSPGSATVSINNNRLRIVISNRVRYAAQMYNIHRRLQWAINLQRNNLERQIKFNQQRAARQAGFRTR